MALCFPLVFLLSFKGKSPSFCNLNKSYNGFSTIVNQADRLNIKYIFKCCIAILNYYTTATYKNAQFNRQLNIGFPINEKETPITWREYRIYQLCSRNGIFRHFTHRCCNGDSSENDCPSSNVVWNTMPLHESNWTPYLSWMFHTSFVTWI